MAPTSGGEKSVQMAEKQNPIVLDLGKHKRKSVKQLRRGEGKLLNEALESIQELQRVGTIPQSAQPVILIVREKSKPKSMFPMMGR
jgi:hypothetical protein